MSSRYKDIAARLEREIAAARDQLAEEIKYEQAIGKKNLLMSRTYALKVMTLEKRRSKLERVSNIRKTRRKAYDDILRERTKAVDIAEQEVASVLVLVTTMIAAGNINKSPTFEEDLKTYQALLRSKKVILGNKRRALNNWLDREPASVPITREDEMVSSYGKFKENLKKDVIVDSWKTTHELETADPLEQLKRAQFWNKPSAKDSHPSIDSISNQPTTHAEINDPASSLKDVADPLDPKNQKYKPTIIDL